jgi:hypothetical protein
MFFGGDPFEHFAQSHGGGRGGGGRARAPNPDVDTTKLYETLGVRSVLVCYLFKYLDLLTKLTTFSFCFLSIFETD